MNIKVVTPPAKLPVTVAETKTHLRIEIDDDDLDIGKKIKAVVARLDPPDGILGRALITQTLRYSLEKFPAGQIRLPYPPAQSIASIKYIDSSEVEQPVAVTVYQLKTDSDPARIILKYNQDWPTDSLSENDPFPVKIEFIAGYGDDSEDIPEIIRLGIMMEVGDYYLQRENISLGQAIIQNEFSRRVFDNFIWRHIEA
jgi:uncharacterized phiE125 gp8 family phage protein